MAGKTLRQKLKNGVHIVGKFLVWDAPDYLLEKGKQIANGIINTPRNLVTGVKLTKEALREDPRTVATHAIVGTGVGAFAGAFITNIASEAEGLIIYNRNIMASVGNYASCTARLQQHGALTLGSYTVINCGNAEEQRSLTQSALSKAREENSYNPVFGAVVGGVLGLAAGTASGVKSVIKDKHFFDKRASHTQRANDLVETATTQLGRKQYKHAIETLETAGALFYKIEAILMKYDQKTELEVIRERLRQINIHMAQAEQSGQVRQPAVPPIPQDLKDGAPSSRGPHLKVP